MKWIGIAVIVAGGFLAVSPASAAPALCAGKGTVDTLKNIPASLVPAARQLFTLNGADASFVQTSTSYRCVQNQVWLCNYGANLVCDKANTNRQNPGAIQWCKDNANATVVPMSATGHDTIYSYVCDGRNPRVTGPIEKVDARGFLADNWKRLP